MAHSLTIAQAEAEVRLFAVFHPTPNVKKAVDLAESGSLSWFVVYDLFRSSLEKALEEVRS